MATKKVVVGINGPIDSKFSRVFLFESAFFDSASSNSSSTRISLENRWEAVLEPSKYLDNLVGNLDMFEYELKSYHQSNGKTLVCLYSNQILLNGTREFIDKFKEICKRYCDKFEFVLSMGFSGCQDSITEIESIVSHVHYGSSRGLFFGAIGPFVLNSEDSVRVCIESHKRTNAPVYIDASSNASYLSSLISVVEEESKFFLIVRKFEDWEYVSRHFNDKKLKIIVPCTTSDYRLKAIADNVYFSPGCSQKVHFKKFGGIGFDEGRDLVNSNPDDAFDLLSFAWSPPKLDGQQDDDYGKWVCDICGVRAKLSEQENFTKHGYTYCSIACLSSHRKRGFEPLT